MTGLIWIEATAAAITGDTGAAYVSGVLLFVLLFPSAMLMVSTFRSVAIWLATPLGLVIRHRNDDSVLRNLVLELAGRAGTKTPTVVAPPGLGLIYSTYALPVIGIGPMIIIPKGWLEEFPIEELSAVIGHELHHVKHDLRRVSALYT